MLISPAVQVHQHFVFFGRVRFPQDQPEYWQNDVGRDCLDVRWIGNVNVEASFGFGEEFFIAFRVPRLHAQERGSCQTVEVAICCARLPASISTRLGAEFRCKVFECRMNLQSVNALSNIANEDSMQSHTMYEFSLLPAAAMACVCADARLCMLRLY